MRVGVDRGRNRTTTEEYRKRKHHTTGDDQRLDCFSFLLFGSENVYLIYGGSV